MRKYEHLQFSSGTDQHFSTRKIDCNNLPSLLKRNILVFALIRNIKFHYKLYSIISDELFNIFKTRISLLANCSWNIAKVTIKQTGIVHVRLVKTGKGWDGLWTKNLMIFLIFGEFDNSWEMKGYMYLNKNQSKSWGANKMDFPGCPLTSSSYCMLAWRPFSLTLFQMPT